MTEVETHTMGPWEVTDQNGDPEGSFRGVRGPTRINSLGKPYNTYVAQYCLPTDARLIAAAPKMLVALKSAAERLKTMASMTGCRSDDEWVWAAQEQVNAAIDLATQEYP